MRDQIIEMLGKGIAATQVASAVGCDDSYISQLLSEEGVTEKVTALKAAHFSAYVEQDKKVDEAETAILDRLTTLIPYITKPTEAARVYGVLNNAKRRTGDSLNAAAPIAATVQIDLPESARVRLTLTHDKQVIEVEGRSMTTMPATSMAARLEQRQASRLLATTIPTTLPITLDSQHVREVANSIAENSLASSL